MTLLLRQMWRNVSKSTTAFNVRSMSNSVSELPPSPRPSDTVMATLKSASSSSAVLAAVQTHLPQLDHRHLLQALRTIFDLQKTCRSKAEAEALIKDPAFAVLCQNFKKHARALDVNEAIEATKVLSYLNVPVNSLIVQTMLQLIRSNINIINIKQVMFLDFLLTRFDSKNHLVDALKLALPLVFQIHLPMQLDNQDLPLLRDMLSYCCTHDLPDRCINNVVTGLLLHDQAIDGRAARSIIWSLCDVNCTEELFPTRVQLLHICYDILSQNLSQLTYDDVLRTAAKIKGRILDKHPEYYHEQFMDAIADYVVDNAVEFEKALLVARVLSRIAHTNLRLVEYLCKEAAADSETLASCRTNILFSFINCLSNNNYKPERELWDRLKEQISRNPVLEGKNPAMPWTKICLELASLGHYEDRLLKRVFSEEFLQEFLARDDNYLDYLQLLTLHEAVSTFHTASYGLPPATLARARELYPTHALTPALNASLARGLGGSQFVANNVRLPNGIVADLLTCLKNGFPVKLPKIAEEGKVPIENLNLPSDGIVLCVMNFSQGCFSMNSNRLRGTFRLVLDILERQGYAAVAVNCQEWQAVPAHERAPYLLRELSYKCGEIGMKLCAG